MRRRLSVLIAFTGVLGMIGFAPVAQAGHDLKAPGGPGPHEGSPIPVDLPVGETFDTCTVQGTVAIGNHQGNGGVDLAPMGEVNHNHYKFVDTDITCQTQNTRYGGRSYNVDAAGGTDGGGVMKTAFGMDHGESASVGWSHSSCYHDDTRKKSPLNNCNPPANHKAGPGKTLDDLYDGTNVNGGANPTQCTNCGEIAVRSTDDEKISDPRTPGTNGLPPDAVAGDPASTNNWVKFCRGVYNDNNEVMGVPVPDCTGSTDGANVIAWGALTHPAGKDKPADEVVCFHADLIFVPEPKVGDTKVNQATLAGEALLWVTDDKGDCEGAKGKKS